MRGLGRFLPQHNRALVYDVTNTNDPGFRESFTILTPADCGLTPSWFSGPYGGALGIPAALRCSTVLSGLIGELPLHGYRSRAGMPAVKLDPTPSLLEDPAAGQDTRITVISSWVLDYLHHGNSIAVIASRNAEGWPTSCWPVPAEWVQVRPLQPDELFDEFGVYRGWAEYDIGGRRYFSRDVIHVKALCPPGALRGLGILEAALSTITHAQEQQTQAGSLSRHGVPTGLLKALTNTDVTPADLQNARADWLAAQRTRTIAALPPGVDFTPISWNPEQLQLIEASKLSDQRIAQLYGLPLRYLGLEIGGLTYSTPQADSVDLLKMTVNQILVRFEQEMTRHLPRGTWARFNRDAILATDALTRYQAHAIAVDPDRGWMSRAEIRQIEDLPPEAEPADPEDPAEPDDPADDDAPPEEGADDV